MEEVVYLYNVFVYEGLIGKSYFYIRGQFEFYLLAMCFWSNKLFVLQLQTYKREREEWPKLGVFNSALKIMNIGTNFIHSPTPFIA